MRLVFFAEPSESGATREIALENWTGVDVRSSRRWMSHCLVDPFVERVEFAPHHVVIIISARISRDRTCRSGAAVIQPDYDRALHAGKRETGVAALLGPARQVFHLACVSVREPCPRMRRRFRRDPAT